MDIATVFAGSMAVASLALLTWKVTRALSRPTIRVTRADTGASVVLDRPTANQSRNERSAQVHKLLELVSAA
ncbi:hypothetical protein A0257_06375 [Hymenobacter psoromatis]|nr:hypothetical protein A0257_06375 [Hymenobacter psoromatis]